MHIIKHITVFLLQASLLQICLSDTELITQPQEEEHQQHQPQKLNIQSEVEPLTNINVKQINDDRNQRIKWHQGHFNKQEVTSVNTTVGVTPRISIGNTSSSSSRPLLPSGGAAPVVANSAKLAGNTKPIDRRPKKDTKKPMFYKIIKKIEYGPKPNPQRRSHFDHHVMVRPVHQHSALPVKFYIKPHAPASNFNKVYHPVVPKPEYKFPPIYQNFPPHQQNIKWTSTLGLPKPSPYSQFSLPIGSTYQFNQFGGDQSYKKIPPNSYVSYKATIPKYPHKANPPTIHQYSTVAASPSWPASHVPQTQMPHIPEVPQWHQQSFDSFSPVALPHVSYKPPKQLSQHSGEYESHDFAPYKGEYQQKPAANQYAVEEHSFEEPRQPKYLVPKLQAQPAPSFPPAMQQIQFAQQQQGHEFQNYEQPELSPEIDYSSYQPNGQHQPEELYQQTVQGLQAQAHKMNYPSLAAIQQFSNNYMREEVDTKLPSGPPQYQYNFGGNTEGHIDESPRQSLQLSGGLDAHARDPTWTYQQTTRKPEWASQEDPSQWYTSTEEHQSSPEHYVNLQQSYAWRQKTQDGAVIQVSQHAQESRPEVIQVQSPQSNKQTHEVRGDRGLSQQYPDENRELAKEQLSGEQETSVVKVAKGQQDSMIANGWTPIINNQ